MNRKKAKVLRKIVKGTLAPVVTEVVKRTKIVVNGEVTGEKQCKMTAHPIKSWRRNYQDAKVQLKQEHRVARGVLKGAKP